MFVFSLGLSLWGWSPGRVGEGCGGRWPLALPEDPVWLGVPSSGWWPSVPLKWPSHATAGNTLSSIVSTARGLLMLHLPCLLLPGSPSEPLLRAGETALGLSAWNLHEKSESEKQLLTSIYMQSIFFFFFFGLPLLISYSCGNACFPPILQFPQTPRAQRVCVSKPPATTSAPAMLVMPQELQGTASCEVLCGCPAMGCSCCPAVGVEPWDSQHQPGWAAASGSWLCVQENWRLQTADPPGKITVDCPPFPSPLTGKTWYKWVAMQSYIQNNITQWGKGKAKHLAEFRLFCAFPSTIKLTEFSLCVLVLVEG